MPQNLGLPQNLTFVRRSLGVRWAPYIFLTYSRHIPSCCLGGHPVLLLKAAGEEVLRLSFDPVGVPVEVSSGRHLEDGLLVVF